MRGFGFPFLLGGTFIEAEQEEKEFVGQIVDFPSFWEGLSLRHTITRAVKSSTAQISLPFGRDFH